MRTTPAGVCAAQLARGATVSFGCPGVSGTSCHSAVCSTLLSWPIFYSVIRGVDFIDILWGYGVSFPSLPPLLRFTLDGDVRTAKSIFSAPFWLRERRREKSWTALKCRSLLQIYEPISANAAQKSWLSPPPGKCWSVRHIFITLVQYHTGQLIGKSWMFSSQA